MLDEYLLSTQKQTSPTYGLQYRRKRQLVGRIDTERVTVTGATATMTAAKRAAKTATKTATRTPAKPATKTATKTVATIGTKTGAR